MEFLFSLRGTVGDEFSALSTDLSTGGAGGAGGAVGGAAFTSSLALAAWAGSGLAAAAGVSLGGSAACQSTGQSLLCLPTMWYCILRPVSLRLAYGLQPKVISLAYYEGLVIFQCKIIVSPIISKNLLLSQMCLYLATKSNHLILILQYVKVFSGKKNTHRKNQFIAQHK